MSRWEYSTLNNTLIEVLTALHGDEAAYRARIGASEEEVGALLDELSLVRYDVFGEARLRNPRDGSPWGPTEPRKTGTAWDGLPKIEAKALDDGRITFVLARNELSVFENSLSVTLEALRFDDSELVSRMGRTAANLEGVMAEIGRVRLQLGRTRRRRATSEDGSGSGQGTNASTAGRDEHPGAGSGPRD